MTSSPPDGEKPERVPGWRQPWDTWRITMFGGSLVLLALAIFRSREGGLPEWFLIVGQFIGYGLLAYGFYLAMKTKKKIKEENQPKKERATPRDPG